MKKKENEIRKGKERKEADFCIGPHLDRNGARSLAGNFGFAGLLLKTDPLSETREPTGRDRGVWRILRFAAPSHRIDHNSIAKRNVSVGLFAVNGVRLLVREGLVSGDAMKSPLFENAIDLDQKHPVQIAAQRSGPIEPRNSRAPKHKVQVLHNDLAEGNFAWMRHFVHYRSHFVANMRFDHSRHRFDEYQSDRRLTMQSCPWHLFQNKSWNKRKKREKAISIKRKSARKEKKKKREKSEENTRNDED